MCRIDTAVNRIDPGHFDEAAQNATNRGVPQIFVLTRKAATQAA